MITCIYLVWYLLQSSQYFPLFVVGFRTIGYALYNSKDFEVNSSKYLLENRMLNSFLAFQYPKTNFVYRVLRVLSKMSKNTA